MVEGDVTLLKATLLETRAKLLLRGGYFDSGEELCRTCISIRTVMLGHSHAQTLAAQETLPKITDEFESSQRIMIFLEDEGWFSELAEVDDSFFLVTLVGFNRLVFGLNGASSRDLCQLFLQRISEIHG
ncbi:hypothetical protein AgCh_013930 [Apium graveolens]